MAERSPSPARDRKSPPRGPRVEEDRRNGKSADRDRQPHGRDNRADRDRDRDRDRDYDRDRDNGLERYRARDSDRRRDRGSDGPGDRDGEWGRRPRGRRGGGFKWKDDRRNNDDRRRDDRPYRRRSQSPRRRDRDRDSDRNRNRNRDRPESSKPKKDDKPTVPAAPTGGEEMIIVYVNDRLGTRASIPCYASDRIKEFKILVAARIGREPHEILLKRQGERPFKDQLSLEDYGVSNGVQLDLEVDTGD